jgi:flavin-dependent dehydrogenase
MRDALVVGGGPAGLAFAIAAAGRGLSVTVLERQAEPVDKACGEGVLPAGVRALDALGVLGRIAPDDRSTIRELRWIDARAAARLRLPAPHGLGVRRTALSAALAGRAREAGVELVRADVEAHHRASDRVTAVTSAGRFEGRVLVAADGLASPVRRREGLDRTVAGAQRYGLRRHFAVPPWSDAVEVHFGDRAEAYVTPAGGRRVGVAFLFERGAATSFEELLDGFPALAGLLRGARADSEARGAGPLARSARARVRDRLVLLGDAAGYLDAVTGDGLAVAFACALGLADLLPDAIARGATARALRPYEAIWRRHYAPYWAFTRLVLSIARRPTLRGRVLALASTLPRPFEEAVRVAVG